MLSSEVWRAIVLGVVQGIAEFLPISSSGHLVVAEHLLGASSSAEASLRLNVVLHLGTLFSILVVYRKDLWALLRQFNLCLCIVVATVPLGIVGLTLKSLLSRAFETPEVVVVGWITTAGLLLIGQRWSREAKTCRLEEMTPVQAFLVGLFQAVALVPGISRAGSTIAGGLFNGLDRNDATKFSFFIAIPAISAAVLHTAMQDSATTGTADINVIALAAGAVTAFVVGLCSLKLLIKAVSLGRLHWFAYYCVICAVGTSGVLAWEFMSLKAL